MQPGSFDEIRQALDEARSAWEVERRSPGSRIPLGGLVQRLFNRLGPGPALDAALADQRAFNAAVVRTLEALERGQREQVATTLLLALDLLGQIGYERVEGTSSDLPHPPET